MAYKAAVLFLFLVSMALFSVPSSSAMPTAQSPSTTSVDVAFIIDSSGSIGATNYQYQKNFVKAVAKSFGVAPGKSRAAMVLFGNSASVKARFGQYTTMEEFGRAVDALPYESGMTRIDKALDVVATEIFPEARADVPKIALLITDGMQTQTADAKGLKEASEPLPRAGVYVLAVGIGSGVDASQLRLVTESDDDVMVANDFQDLLLKVDNIKSKATDLKPFHQLKNMPHSEGPMNSFPLCQHSVPPLQCNPIDWVFIIKIHVVGRRYTTVSCQLDPKSNRVLDCGSVPVGSSSPSLICFDVACP
ncbi:cuticlin-6-like [Oculina patagonica]